jgi:hypothetical protein
MSKPIFGTVVIVALMLFVGCMPPPPVRPALSQTVVTIQRYASNVDAKLPMYVYIDDTKSNYYMTNGESIAIPVNDGVHYIFVEVGKYRSEMLNFTAAQKTVSFVASVERQGLTKRKVVLSRSRVIDDTGEMTDKNIQKRYVPDESEE